MIIGKILPIPAPTALAMGSELAGTNYELPLYDDPEVLRRKVNGFKHHNGEKKEHRYQMHGVTITATSKKAAKKYFAKYIF